MTKINVPVLAIGESIIVSGNYMIVSRNNDTKADIYNMKGEVVSSFDLKVTEKLSENFLFGKNAFIREIKGVYHVMNYEGKVIKEYKYKGKCIWDMLRCIFLHLEKPFYKGFRERMVVSNQENSHENDFEFGTKIWISEHYLIKEIAHNGIEIYNIYNNELLGTIPQENYKRTASLKEILEDNCYWFGAYMNMMIKEKKGWTIVTQNGEVLVENISDELLKMLIGNKSEEGEEKVLEYNGLEIKQRERLYKFSKVLVVEEFNTSKFRFYSSSGNHIVTTLLEKRLTDCFKATEKWIAVMIKGNYYNDSEWQIFDYNGKVICESVFRIFQVQQMWYAIGSSLLYPDNETLWIFNLKGELKTKIEGYRFKFEDDTCIKVYISSGGFEIYDLNGVKVESFTFDEEVDIVWEDSDRIVLHKTEKDNEYVEYNLKTREIHYLKCQEIRVIDDSDELIVMIRKNGQWGVFKYVGVNSENTEFYGFEEIIPIKYDKISGNGYYSYAKYTGKDLYGYQETFEDVYDQDGNLIMTVEL